MSNYELAGSIGGAVVGGGIGFGADVLLYNTGLIQGFNYDTRLLIYSVVFGLPAIFLSVKGNIYGHGMDKYREYRKRYSQTPRSEL